MLLPGIISRFSQTTGQGRQWLPGPLFCLFFCLLGLSGCGSGSAGGYAARQNMADSNSAKVTSVSRVFMPAAGGQTILPPQLMGDAQTLWAPLSGREKALRGPYPVAAKLDKHMIAWLPSDEDSTMNRYLYRLTRERRDLTERVLLRAEEHLPVILEHLHRQGLPLELACLPMVESAFEARAVSKAGAAGLWQLMPVTARRFGLQVNNSVDERFDVAKSTGAAVAYLDFLYAKFGDWPLALAAYNCGEGNMQRALEQSKSETLSALTVSCRNSESPRLTEETLQFVPQFAAVVLAMSQSDKLGLRAAPLLALDHSGLGYREFGLAGTRRSGPLGLQAGRDDMPAGRDRSEVRLSLMGDYQTGDHPEQKPMQSKRLP